jgi:hypothetical protein
MRGIGLFEEVVVEGKREVRDGGLMGKPRLQR